MSLPKWGGCPFLYALHISNRLLLSSLSCSHRGKFSDNRGKNEFLFGVLWCFLGNFGDNKVQNLNIFLEVRKENGWRGYLFACLFSCPLGYVCRLFMASGPACCLALVLWSCASSFCPLCCSSLGALLANVALFRVFRAFLARFMGFVWVCVVLVRCVACGAFVCVRG